MRLDKCLTILGIGSRSVVKKEIQKGNISVNGTVCTSFDRKISDGDTISDGREDYIYHDLVYYLYHKPAGLITAVSDSREAVIMDEIPIKRTDIFPVGRLDKDTEGALLLTNDGELAHRLLSPKREVPKTYFVHTDRDIPENAAELFRVPIEFSDFTSSPSLYEPIDKRCGLLTITEGKFHEVKRLFHHIGCEVVYLRRESFAGINLGDLPKGSVRELSSAEVKELAKRVGI